MQDEIDKLIVGGEPAGKFAPHVKVWSEMGVRVIVLRALKSRPTTRADEDKAKINAAIEIALKYGGVDGSHHKNWVIDQMIRALAGDEYSEIVRVACDGDDGPDTYTWETGIAP
jgi:hypothetical protein